ncbi:thioesterase domain-containing protein [Streptomyces sp. ML-6]|uniref:thioesterase II family protein n=1 Tax=Streptomyces sp. ML-6 TaxID=2982693 RepID=UPI0024BF439E|nr:thioesterase domain-containing protein [Streptomyces sp. ML-6]MDK0521937.1 thioesterase domain-containing protein [Streptomyces sp. ML-6]
MSEQTDVWFRRFKRVPRPRLRLVGLPHAGGAASMFRNWPQWLPDDVELLGACYPGRQDRLGDPCVTRMGELADALTEALLPVTEQPLALFGHSMGASVAFEVAHRLEHRHGVVPAVVFVSGQQPPARYRSNRAHLGGDAGLLAEVERLGGDGTKFLDSPEMRELLMPAIRGDFALMGSYRPDPSLRITAPVEAWVGDADCDVTVEETRAWSDTTSGSFNLRVFSGDHFYLTADTEEFGRRVDERLSLTAVGTH